MSVSKKSLTNSSHSSHSVDKNVTEIRTRSIQNLKAVESEIKLLNQFMSQMLGEEPETPRGPEQSSFVQFCQNMISDIDTPNKNGRLNKSIAEMETQVFAKLNRKDEVFVEEP